MVLHLIQLFSAASIGLLFSLLAARSVEAGLFLIAAAFLSEELLGPTSLIFVAGANVGAPDVCAAALTFAAFMRAQQKRKWSALHFLWIAFGACILFSWVRGIEAFGLNQATNSLRGFIGLWAAGTYVVTFETSAISFDHLFRWWTIMSLSLLLIILSRYFYPLYSIDLSLSAAREDGYDDLFDTGFASASDWGLLRVVGATSALVIAQTALLGMIAGFGHRGGPSTFRWLVPIWLVLVLLLQHRTVWVTFVACAALLLPCLKIRTSALLGLAGLLALALLSSAIYLAAGSGESIIVTSLGGAIGEISDVPESTWFFRTQLWLNYLDQFLGGSVIEYAFGQPFGTIVFSSIRVGMNLIVTSVFPHNFYVYCGFYLGAVGLVVFLVVYALLLRSLWPNRTAQRAGRFSGRELAIFLIGQLVFLVTYSLSFEQAVFTGAAITFAVARRSATVRFFPVAVRARHSRP